MSALYTEIIQDAFRHPAHRGELSDATHAFAEENPLCGDTLQVQMRIVDGIIAEAKFEGRGCVISQAAAELMLERIEGQPVSALAALDKDTVLAELGLPAISPARLKCALLCLSVLKGCSRTAGAESG